MNECEVNSEIWKLGDGWEHSFDLFFVVYVRKFALILSLNPDKRNCALAV